LGPTRAGPTPFDDLALLHELWQVSHFGWIAEATIRRSLMIASGHEIAAAALAQRLGQLRQLGWVEECHSEADTDQREWRLTDSGRSAV
jgi:DNA-binding HxlR family transcriptional regulator